MATWSSALLRRTAWATPSGMAISEGEGEGDADEDEVVGQLMDHERVDALVQAVGVAEVPVQDVGEKRQVLHHDRAVEPVRPVEGGDRAPALARGPRMARARLPGMRCSSTNTSSVTPSRTTTAWARRRSVNPIMSGPSASVRIGRSVKLS